jgi:hypothetical protein
MLDYYDDPMESERAQAAQRLEALCGRCWGPQAAEAVTKVRV